MLRENIRLVNILFIASSWQSPIGKTYLIKKNDELYRKSKNQMEPKYYRFKFLFVLCHTTISYPFITPIAAYIVINSITFDLFSSLPAMVLLDRCTKYPSSAEKNS